MRSFAPVGNGRVIAYVMAEGMSYVRGTNLVRAVSAGREVRFGAAGEEIVVGSSDQQWPPELDPPPLGGATRAAIVERIPDLPDRAAVTELYARSVLVLAQHQDVAGAFMAELGDDVLIAYAMDVVGERGAAEDFYAWALDHRSLDGRLMWGLEQHVRVAHGTELRERLARLKDGPGPELAAEPPHLPEDGLGYVERAMHRRSSLDLFFDDEGLDLRSHALFLIAVHDLMPPVRRDEDFFFQRPQYVQDVRRSRALYGGAYHPGLTGVDENPLDTVEVNPSLEPAHASLQPVAGGRYKIEVQGRIGKVWASDADPRSGGQEFAYGTKESPPDWVHDAVVYHVMVDRFSRHDGPLPPPGSSTALYGGTLEGVRAHLDHIASLGCNTVWLSPVHQSPSHHGYDVEDFYRVEPRYGGETALRDLIEAAHARAMRVLLDFVPNHTGRGNLLFRRATEMGGEQAEFYRFWQWPHYYRCFFDHILMPELDTARPRVQEHLVEVAQHWVTHYGADGLRCDHVAGVDPAFWIELRRGLRAVKADALVLGEATGHPEWIARYAGRLDAIFDFDFAYVVRKTFARGRMRADEFANWLDGHEHAYPGLAAASLLDNHDMNRFLWLADGDVDRLKLAAILLMTLPGTPVIYYGTEVGVTQRHDALMENAEARLPMLWDSAQDQDLLAHFQRLGRLRHQSAALRRGLRRTLHADARTLVYERVLGDERFEVALDLARLTGKVVDGSGRDRLREDDVLGVGPNQGSG